MSAMLSVTQLEPEPEPEPEPEVFHEYLKPTPEMKWPLLSIWIGADVCLNHESYAPTGAFKIREDCTISNASPKEMTKR